MRAGFLSFILLISSLWGDGSGAKVLKGQEFQTYTHNGYLTIYETDFTDFLHVNGSLQGSRCQIFELQVNGEASLHECVIHGPMMIKGALIADHSVFQGPIILTANTVTFDRCAITDSIEVRSVGSEEGKQVIKMTNGAVVQGNITFNSKNGEVHLSKDSRVCGGVVGGRIRLFAQ